MQHYFKIYLKRQSGLNIIIQVNKIFWTHLQLEQGGIYFLKYMKLCELIQDIHQLPLTPVFQVSQHLLQRSGISRGAGGFLCLGVCSQHRWEDAAESTDCAFQLRGVPRFCSPSATLCLMVSLTPPHSHSLLLVSMLQAFAPLQVFFPNRHYFLTRDKET